jgi:hypothetical protein
VSDATYREQALKIYPWICGRCAREFTSANLRELTVHHRDHNHSNNPPDGSNWELLCLYCHDNEHQKQLEAATGRRAVPPRGAPRRDTQSLRGPEGADGEEAASERVTGPVPTRSHLFACSSLSADAARLPSPIAA